MARPLVVMVEADERYLIPLQHKMAETVMDQVEIEVISSLEYMHTYFLSPRNISILIIDEKLYDSSFQKHNIDKVYLLTEQENAESSVSAGEERVCIFKYYNIQTLIDYMIPSEWSGGKSKQGPQIVAVISPAGGTGATTVSVGVCTCMKQNLKNTLYLNAGNFQSFQYFLENKTFLTLEACAALKDPDEHIYEKMEPFFIEDSFTYLPPLKASRESLGVNFDSYFKLAQAACKSGKYDYIFIDVGYELSAGVIRKLKDADKVLVVTRQDAYNTFKFEILKASVNFSDAEKYYVLCNCFDKNRENALLNAGNNIREYIDVIEREQLQNSKMLGTNQGIKKAAFTLL